MSLPNYTPINNHIKKQPFSKISPSPEVEPAIRRNVNFKENIECFPKKKAEAFIKKNKETITLSSELKKIGLQAYSTEQLSDYKDIALPISDDKILIGLRSSPIHSLRWLATLAMYTLKQAHLGLKIVHGHVVRVFKK